MEDYRKDSEFTATGVTIALAIIIHPMGRYVRFGMSCANTAWEITGASSYSPKLTLY